jgi:hypothetical protein
MLPLCMADAPCRAVFCCRRAKNERFAQILLKKCANPNEKQAETSELWKGNGLFGRICYT